MLDLRNYKLADLRNQFAVVLQDTVLFSTTITQNIQFARPGATIAEVCGGGDSGERARVHS